MRLLCVVLLAACWAVRADEAPMVEADDSGSLWLRPAAGAEQDVHFAVDGDDVPLKTILKRLSDVEAVLDQLKAAVLTPSTGLADVVTALSPVVSGLSSDVNTLKQQVSQTGGLITRMGAAEGTIGTLSSDVSTLKNEVSAAGGLVSRMGTAENDISSLKGDVASLKSQVQKPTEGLLDRVDKAEGSVEELQSQVGDLTTKVTGNSNAINTADTGLLARVDEAEADIEELQNAVPDGLTPVKIGIQAAGLCNGNFVKLFRNDQAQQVTAGRGITIFVLEPLTATIKESRTYDTHDKPADTQAMVDFLNAQETGTVVLFGMRDSGVNALSAAAFAAIKEYGSQYIDFIGFREAWAMIGIKGAGAGTVPEDHGGISIDTGCNPTNTYRPTKVVEQYFFGSALGPMNKELARQLALVSQHAPGTQANPAYSCEELRALGFSSGTYFLAATGADPFEAYCDQDNEDGGWMLMLAVDHAAGQTQAINRNQLPLSPTGYYGYANLNSVGITDASYIKEVRFYCQTSLHTRKVHFKTTNRNIATTAITGKQYGQSDYRIGFYPLSGHNAVIPGESVDGGYTQNDGFSTFPFYKGGANHWGIGENGGNRFECDDYPNGPAGRTLHQVYVRANPGPLGRTASNPIRDCNDLRELPGYRSGVYWAQLKEDATPIQVWCDTEIDGGGWMLLLAYQHERNVNTVLDGSKLPVDRDFGYSHTTLQAIGLASDWVKEVRFKCTSSAHNRMVHFKTNNDLVLAQAFDGKGRGANGFTSGVTKLPGHNAFIPDQVTDGFTGDTDGFTNFPFYTSSQYHWGIRGSNTRWECDDFVNSDDHRTHHMVFVRSKIGA